MLGEESQVDEFLSYTNYISDFVMFLVVVDIIGLFILMFMEKYDPRIFITWLIVLILVPPAGLILYMYMGSTIYNRRKFTPKNITDREMMNAVEAQSNILELDFAEHPGRADVYRMAKSLDRAGAWSYSKGNDITLFTEGRDKMDSLFEDLRSAKKTILMEYYIIRNDRTGNELMDILTGKVREGVEVRLLTDGFGIGKGPKQGILDFKRAGGHYAMFHSSITLMLSPKKNNRNHRKIAVIDGRIGYCGGFNIGDEYLGEGPLGHWRDASARVVGPGVLPLIGRFCADWHYSSKRDPLRPVREYVSMDLDVGADRMQLVSGGPDTMPNNPVQMQYLSMITGARRRLYITTPYLVPDDSIMVALVNAARSGVDVRILIPDKKDHMFVYWNNMTYSYELMKAGVRIWRYMDGFIHEKLIVMDEYCCSIGSANLDNRSLVLNFEANLMVYSRRIADQAVSVFLGDLERSREYTLEEYEARTTKMKVRMAVSRQLRLLA